MLAVIKTGGSQYKVAEGNFLSVQKLPCDVGSTVTIDQVLMLDDGLGKVIIGTPTISGASVTAKVVEQKRQKTVLIFKKSRRKNYRRKNGHRQPVTILQIENIANSGH